MGLSKLIRTDCTEKVTNDLVLENLMEKKKSSKDNTEEKTVMAWSHFET